MPFEIQSPPIAGLVAVVGHGQNDITGGQLRQQVATRYTEALRHLTDAGIIVPTIPDGCISVWAQYTIRCSERDALQDKLKRAGIPTMVYYVKPMHLLGAMVNLGYKQGDFPNTEEAARSVLSLPFSPYSDFLCQDKIVLIVAG